MNRPALCLAPFLIAFSTAGQDVYVPPVPIGIARDGQTRTTRPVPFPSEEQQWIRVRTPHFDVLSSADAKRTDEIVRNFETLAAALIRADTRFATGATPTTVFVFAKRRESQPYFDLLLDQDRAPATGVYVRHDGGGSMFIDAGKRIERTAMHELVHDLLRQGELVPPLWVEEGLAEFVANARIAKGEVVAGELLPEHVALLRRHGPRPIEELFALGNSSEAAAAPRFYAQSWAAVHWLMQIGGAEKFFAFLREVETKTPVAEALQKHYGKSTKDLHQGTTNLSPRTVKLKVPEGLEPPVPTTTQLDRATLLFELGRFLTHVAGAEREPQRHFREALRLDPNHARALAAVGEFEKAIAANPHDLEVRLTYAETLLQHAIGPFAGVFEPAEGDAERFRKARAVLEGFDTPLAHGFLGTTYLVEDDLRPGIAHLERAPERDDFALNLYAMYLRTGDRARADALYARALASSRDQQTRFAARNVLLVAETTRANALAKTGQLDEAAKIVRDLAAATPDDKARRELETEAARLESTAAVNRHITMYNDAIARTNAGKTREALKILEELLRVATDPIVLRDAKKLQADLRKR